jgi:hypothetical protein
VIDVLNDTSDETREREAGRIEKSDSESHPRRDPLGVPQPTPGRMSLERRDQGEDGRGGKHKDRAVLWKAAVTCSSGQQSGHGGNDRDPRSNLARLSQT